jgi:beta-galactosidase
VEELPKPTRTVVTVSGFMRGVGGIDTWGNDVEKAYHIHSDKDLEFSFRLHI